MRVCNGSESAANRRLSALERVDWEFADYVGSHFPTDINNLHWYPGTFVPQIPSILVKAFSEEGDLVLDPFMGAGTTLIECSRLWRRCIGIDINPYAVDIVTAKIEALGIGKSEWFTHQAEAVVDLDLTSARFDDQSIQLDEARRWFHPDTLAELVVLHDYVEDRQGQLGYDTLRVVFSSILKRVCSQKDHYTYVTDRCFPKDLVYRPALRLFEGQMKLLGEAVTSFHDQYFRLYSEGWSASGMSVYCADSRQLDGIGTGSIDLIVTSPPYLGVNDYVRSMRLAQLFFPHPEAELAIAAEIGARRKRQRRGAFEEFMGDMSRALDEIARVLRPGAYLCLVFGQGRGKVVRANTVELLLRRLEETHRFGRVLTRERRVKFRRIQVPGVQRESIFILRSEAEGPSE